ncbi:hypothetical protein, partial [Paenibacillus lignilyticus]
MAGLVALALPASPAAAAPGVSSGPTAAVHSAQSDEAKALAKATDTGDPVEVLSQRTETSQVIANPSGTFTQDVYATPQWTQQDHTLVPIDPTLTKGSDGRIATKATTVAVPFTEGGSTPMGTGE